MATNPEMTGATSVTDEGRTKIADTVVAKVAGLAAREIAGVHELLPQSVGGTISGLAQRVSGGDLRAQGVAVEVKEHEAAIALKMVVDYGVSIPQLTSAIRRNVINRVGTLTGLTVTEVNIEVSDLYFAEERRAEPRASGAEPRSPEQRVA